MIHRQVRDSNKHGCEGTGRLLEMSSDKVLRDVLAYTFIDHNYSNSHSHSYTLTAHRYSQLTLVALEVVVGDESY